MSPCKFLFNIVLSAVVTEAFYVNATRSEQNDTSLMGHYYNKKSMNTESVRDTLRKLHQNFSYIDTPDNSMHVPFFEETKSKKKLKKSPKRTIQKIIKKSRSKRKFFLNMMTSTSTVEPPRLREEYTQVHVLPLETTEQATIKKKTRFSGRLARYPASYQRAYGSYRPHADNLRRNKRDADRDDVFIIQDFDEVKFLPKQKGYDSANVHVKKYW